MPATQTDPAGSARDLRIARLPRQAKLTRKWLDTDALLAIARAARKEADAEFSRRTAGRKFDDSPHGENSHPDFYPLGYCHIIRDAVWRQLDTHPLIRELRHRGLIWKKVYFIQDGSYFQNAIQCGDVLLDVAHDAVNTKDTPVVITPLDALHYENLDSWDRYAHIAEKYYHMRLYPNVYFPLVFPLAPFLAIRASGRLELLIQQDMIFLLDLDEGWKRARDLLGSPWMKPALPPCYETLLGQLCQENDFDVFPLEFRKAAPEEMAATLESWKDVSALPATDRNAVLQKILLLTRQAAATLRRKGLRPSPEEIDALRKEGVIPSAPKDAPLIPEEYGESL